MALKEDINKEDRTRELIEKHREELNNYLCAIYAGSNIGSIGSIEIWKKHLAKFIFEVHWFKVDLNNYRLLEKDTDLIKISILRNIDMIYTFPKAITLDKLKKYNIERKAYD